MNGHLTECKIKPIEKMKKIFYAVLALACAVTVTSCSSKGNVTTGSKSKMDSLSYCLGANIGFGVKSEMKDIPFDLDVVVKGVKDGALEKADQTQEQAIEVLRDYFMNKRMERKAKLEAEKEADSTLVVDYSAMFESAEERDSVSYAFGNDIGCNVRASRFPVQTYWLTKGLVDAYNGECTVEEPKVMEFLRNYFMVVYPAKKAEQSAEWLEKMSRKSGVQKTESGLLYKVVEEGDMTVAAVNDRDVVVVNYEGKLPTGEVFDSSYERGEPAEFPLNRVIKGWTEGMKLVGKGGKIKLYIPSSLGYGPRGSGRMIGPNEALEFTVEVIDVKPYVEPEATAEEKAELEKGKAAEAKKTK